MQAAQEKRPVSRPYAFAEVSAVERRAGDMREIASPTFRSGSAPTSLATIESIAVAAFFSWSVLDC
jgi:hypothetical protein